MQAVFETVFDLVYLICVIAIGILMICSCAKERQFLLFGIMAVVPGLGDSFFPPYPQSCRAVHDRA